MSSTFTRFLCARTASFAGDGFATVTLAFAGLGVGATPAQLGLLLMAARLPYVCLIPLGGLVGDRFPRIRVLVCADAVRFVVQAVTAVLLLTGTAGLLALALLQGVAAAAAAFFEPAADALVADIVPPARRQRANSALGLSRGVAMVAGPGAAGGIVALGGTGVAYAVDAATFAVSAVLIAGIAAGGDRAAGRFGALAAAGWRAFRDRTWLWLTTVVAMAVNGLCVGPVLALGPLVADRSLHGVASWGPVMAAFAVGGLAGGVLGLRWRPRYPLRAAMILAALCLTPFPTALAVAAPTGALAMAAAVTGAQATLFNTLIATTRQNHVPADLRARVAALSGVSALAALPLGMAAAGMVANTIGPHPVLGISAVCAVLLPTAGLLSAAVRTIPSVDGVGVR